MNSLFRSTLECLAKGVDLCFCAGEKITLPRRSGFVVRDNRINIFFLDLGTNST